MPQHPIDCFTTYLSRVFILGIFCLGVSSPLVCQGADGKAKTLFTDQFERTELGDDWGVHPNSFSIDQGVLVIAQQPTADHGAVGQTYVDFDDIVLKFDFKFAGSPRFNVVIDDRNYKDSHAGHICRVQVAPKLIWIKDDKTGGMANEYFDLKNHPDHKERIAKILKPKGVSAKVDLKAGVWHTMVVTIRGERMSVSIDKKAVASLKSEGIGHGTKTDFGFTVTGQSLHIDNVVATKPLVGALSTRKSNAKKQK